MNNHNLKENQEIVSPHHSYIVNSVLGQGGTSVVYNCTREDKKQKVIIKELLPKFMYSSLSRDEQNALVVQESDKEAFEKMKKLFSRQCEQLDALLNQGNLHILEEKDYFEANNTVYAVYRTVGGSTLNKIEKFETIFEVAQIVDGILECLEPIHENGFLHLDISPDNIFVSETIINNRKKIMLIDYGSIFQVSKDSSELSEEDYESLSHKDKYSANELFRSVEYHEYQKLSYATDLYSVAAVLYKLIFGHAPNALEAILGVTWERFSKHPLFQNYSLRAMKKCASLLTKGLASDMQNRYQTIEEMRKDIGLLLNLCDITKHYLNYVLPPRNPDFFGREEELQQMQTLLLDPPQGKNVQRAIYVYGEDGMGKTELCIEFCHRFQERYDNICFLHFAEDLNITFARMDIQNRAELNFREYEFFARQVVQILNNIEGNTLLIIEDLKLRDRGKLKTPHYGDIIRAVSENIQIIFTSTDEQRDQKGSFIKGTCEVEVKSMPLELLYDRLMDSNPEILKIAQDISSNTLLISFLAQLKQRIPTLDLHALYMSFAKKPSVCAMIFELIETYCKHFGKSKIIGIWVLDFLYSGYITEPLVRDTHKIIQLITSTQDTLFYSTESTVMNKPAIRIHPLFLKNLSSRLWNGFGSNEKEIVDELHDEILCELIEQISADKIPCYFNNVGSFIAASFEKTGKTEAWVLYKDLMEKYKLFFEKDYEADMPPDVNKKYQENKQQVLDSFDEILKL